MLVDNPGNPAIPVQPTPLRHRLKHLAAALNMPGRPVTIVAIGSSSTFGEGGVRPYPKRLETVLQAKYGTRVIVANKGASGEEAPAELARFRPDVIHLNPDLVIWQVGTNSVWNGESPHRTMLAIWRGLDLLATELPAADVILMDLQYAPALLTPNRVELANRMVDLIAEAAATARAPVNVFRRFAMMRAWHELEQISFDQIVRPGDEKRLHQSEWATGRLADAVFKVIGYALEPPDAVPPPIV